LKSNVSIIYLITMENDNFTRTIKNDVFAAVILAAGSSLRMGGVKKEFLKLKNDNFKDDHLTVLGSAVSAFAAFSSVKFIVIAVPQNGETAARAALPKDFLTSSNFKIIFVDGGNTRCASVYNALCALAPYNPGYVLIHDGARPWVSPALIKKTIEKVLIHDAVIPLLPLTDTPKELQINSGQSSVNDDTVFIKTHLKRTNIGVAQTPQVFKFSMILQAHEKAALENEEFTDDAEVWGRFIGKVAVVPGEPENRKITCMEDMDR